MNSRKLSSFISLYLCASFLGACASSNYQSVVKRDLQAEDSNTSNQYYELSRKVNDNWTLNGSMLKSEGGQGNALQLTTSIVEAEEGSSLEDRGYFEYFDYDTLHYESPQVNGTYSIGLDYQIQLIELELESDFPFWHPEYLDWSFGIQHVNTDLLFKHSSGPTIEPAVTAKSLSGLLWKAGVDFEYPLNSYLSAYAYFDYSAGLSDDFKVGQHGAALLVRPIPRLEISARAFTLLFADEEFSSAVEVKNHGTALGVKVNF